jgi:hypothetical protein
MATTTQHPAQKTAPAAPALERGAISWPTFLLLAAQMGLVAAVMYLFRIEENAGLLALLPVIAGGFAVHAWLPMAWRQPFFVALSVAGLGLVMGVSALWVLALGGVLIGLCHLPIAWRWRVVLVLAATVLLVALRREWIPGPTQVLPVLGTLFMFRLAIYLYDLRYEKKPASWWERLGYFFMLPNVAFLLFPVIDYQAWRRTWYDKPAADIYQKGLLWMFRGVTHLILYRLVYYYLVPSSAQVVDLWGVLQSMLATYLLYLRVSGLFHLAVGILCLFGYNLPETHHLYYLASSFTDYWRRINIYWKDFMVKLFYYPAFMRMKRLGMTQRLVLATIWVFFGTWALHLYQTFWLLGEAPLSWPDALFWGILGGMVALNTLREANAGRKRTLGAVEAKFQFQAALVYAAKVLGMFAFITFLWSMWSSPTMAAFWSFLQAAGGSAPADWLLFAAILVGLLLVGVLVQYLNSRGVALLPGAVPTLRTAATMVLVGSVAWVLLSFPAVRAVLGGEAAQVVASLQDTKLNQRDQASLEAGYYEKLLGGNGFLASATGGIGFGTQSERPEGWDKTIVEAGAATRHDDLLRYTLKPNTQVVFKEANLTTNAWGMRDRPYDKARPESTYRLAVLGASDEMGWGVEDHQIFENLTEDRLNQDYAPTSGYQRYEILNFSVSGYSLLQNLISLEEAVLAFEPNAVLYMAHANYPTRLLDIYTRTIAEGGDVRFPFLQEVQARAQVRAGMEPSEIERRMLPYVDEIVAWGYRAFVDACREKGVLPVWVFQPRTYDEEGEDLNTLLGHMMAQAKAAGFVVLSLDDAYATVTDLKTIQLRPWDKHPNAEAHRMLGEKLYQRLLENAEVLHLNRPPG